MKNKKISKKSISNILAVSIVLGTTSIANANGFKDINNHWANKEIQEFINKGYINGYPEDNTFRPENPIKRAEFVKIVNKVFNFTELGEENFIDVNGEDPSHWFYNDVRIAMKAGYINGEKDKNGNYIFRPNDLITRQEAAKIITSIKGNSDNNIDKIYKYNDHKSITSWALPYVEGAIEQGYIKGDDNNNLNPLGNLKRSEAVVTLSRTQSSDEVIKIMYTTANDGLNVRSGPGTSYNQIGKLPRNTKVEVLEISNNWAKIKYNNGYAYVSMSYLSDSPVGEKLPDVPETPKYLDSPQNPGVIDENQSQGNIVLEKTVIDGNITTVAITSSTDVQVNYSIYSNGQWIQKTNGENATVDNKPIEGIKINLTNQEPNQHIFYRTKIKGKGWQAWVKDGKISGQIGNGNTIEEIEIREITSNNADDMVKPTIAVDIGHNVERPTKAGAIGLYKEDDLTKAVGEKIIYKLRQQGYNVVETLPIGRYTQSDELKIRANIANLNEADKFISIHFNTFDGSANGTEVYYSSKAGAKNMATNVSKKLSESFGFKNRGAKVGDHLAVLKRTNMPAILVEGCFIDNISDMNKFIQKGSQAYEIMAESIIEGVLN